MFIKYAIMMPEANKIIADIIDARELINFAAIGLLLLIGCTVSWFMSSRSFMMYTAPVTMQKATYAMLVLMNRR